MMTKQTSPTQPAARKPITKTAPRALPKEGRTYGYSTPWTTSRGKVIEVYRRVNGTWVVLHDKTRNVSITLRPSSVF
jgi:hypothetical protein